MFTAIISGVVTIIVAIMVCVVALVFAGVAAYGIMVAGLVKLYKIFCDVVIKLFNDGEEE